MAHQIPEHLKYVSSITIVDGGSSYSNNSDTPPTITITGGGGSGATATASVFDGVINAVNITNIGTGYTSIPTVTVTDTEGGSGSGAVLEAVLASAIATPTEYEEKSSVGAKYTVPEFIREEYSKFVSFIEKYYEYMDSDGNPANLLLNKKYSDLDDINDEELNQRALELAKDFPQILQADRKSLLKNIKSIYESKGSARSIKAYFKLIYNEEIEVIYPSKNILRASDGIWLQDSYVFASTGYNNFEVQNLNGTIADLKYHETVGSLDLIRTIPITIPQVSKISYTSPQVYSLQIKLPEGITSIPGPGVGAEATATVSGGKVTNIEVTNGGLQYSAAPAVVLSGAGSGEDFSARAVLTDGVITSVVILDAGSGYTDGTYSLTFDTSNLRTVIVDRGASTDLENIKAYVDRCLTSVSAAPYTGIIIATRIVVGREYRIVTSGSSDFTLIGAEDNDIGTVFTATASGSGSGTVIRTGTLDAGFSIGQIYRINEIDGNNNAIIRIQSIDNRNAPTAFSIINPGRQFTEAEFNVGIGSNLRESVILTLNTGYLYAEEGKFKDDRGKLSDANRIQDNFRYQSYSYIIKSTLPESTWKKRFKDIMHPAGMEVFGDLIIKHNVGFGQFFTIEAEGLHLHEFKTEDIVTSPDVVTIVVQWVRAFPNLDDNGFDPVDPDSETVYTTDAESFNFGKNPVDIATTSDDYADDLYVESDYLPFAYHGPGVFKLINKVLTSQAEASELLSIAMDYSRSFADTFTATESFSALVEKPFTEVVNISEVFDYSYLLQRFFSDTVGTSDEYDNSLYVELGYLPDLYHGPGVFKHVDKVFSNNLTAGSTSVINTTKLFTETKTISEEVVKTISLPNSEDITASDSGVATIQDYAPTYFAEDYVGASYSF